MESKRATASGIVYLFGEQFVKEAPVFLARCFLNLLDLATDGDSTFAPPLERLVYSGLKVPRDDLATMIVHAAFVSLAQQGYVSLGIEVNDKQTPLTRQGVTISQKKQGDELPPTLERAIMEALGADQKEDRVYAVLERVIGYVGPFSNPFQWVIHYVMERLAEAGYLVQEVGRRPVVPNKVHWSACEEAIAPMAGQAETLRSTLETYAAVDPDLHERLLREVRTGISRAYNPTAW